MDILNSISVIDKYVVSKSANYTSCYDSLKIKDIEISFDDTYLDKRNLDVSYNVVNKKHFDKHLVKYAN